MELARRRRIEDALLSRLGSGLAALCRTLTWRGAQRFGAGLGSLAWALSRRDRRRTLEHLEMAFPELAAAARQDIGRACYRHLATNLTEALHLTGLDCAAALPLVEVEGFEHVEAARASDRPLLVLTAHVGNWELSGPALGCRGVSWVAVARELHYPAVERIFLDLRRRFGHSVIYRDAPGSGRLLLEALRNRQGLFMLIDQDIPADGVWVPFFGRPAYTPVGAARIARRQHAIVLPLFMERQAGGRHLMRILPPLDLPDDLTAATAVMTRAIEEQIRRHPEQWVWMHRRWRRQPSA